MLCKRFQPNFSILQHGAWYMVHGKFEPKLWLNFIEILKKATLKKSYNAKFGMDEFTWNRQLG